jgi:hypothetical protein
MGPNRRAQERRRAAARAAEEAKRAEAERKAGPIEAQKIVLSGMPVRPGGNALWFYPTICAPIAPGFPWLTFSCPACRVVGSVDFDTLDRCPRRVNIEPHPLAVLPAVLTNAPFAKLEMLTAERR